ncbi:sugar porter family MFS transporter [Azorhizobium sp. AG788]|uniref:sugar porter family MFS transporter n=1 Tax=Azorhizobium sp. AG788 TaxID=2183897 RepID=UPI00313880FF
MVYLIASIAGIAGLLFGFDEGVIAGALHLLRAEFGISPLAEGIMTATVPLGAVGGALIGGWLARPVGRRKLLLGAAFLFVVGALLSALAPSLILVCVARLLLGLAIGVAAMIAPLYISETAPARIRGMLVSIYQLAITLGILGAYLVGYTFSDSWRAMFAAGIVPGAALLIGIAILSDTPRWLVLRGRREEARAVIAKTQSLPIDDRLVTAELSAIEAAAQVDLAQGSWRDLFGPVARPALIVGMGLFLLQQLSGINAVIYFAPTVFRLSGFDSTSTQMLATVGIGVVNVLVTVLAMGLIDRIGRRKLLFIGFAGAALSLGLIAAAAATGSPDLQILALIGLVLYVASFAISIGPLPWVMMSEIFPLHLRGPGMSAASITNWVFNFIVVLTFPVLVADIGLAGVFSIYALVCVAGVVFTARLVPETSGISLEDIEKHLKGGKPFSALARSVKAA